jgi:hypothetical protein
MTRDVGRDVDFRWLVYGFLVSFLCNAYYSKSCPCSRSQAHLLHESPVHDTDIQIPGITLVNIRNAHVRVPDYRLTAFPSITRSYS